MKFYYPNEFEFDATLRSSEQALKKLYLQNPYRELERPHDFSSCRDIIIQARKMSRDFPPLLLQPPTLEEPGFFQDDFDCQIYQHLRYLPANWHAHTFFEVACVLSGTCTNYIHDQELTMTSGDICIIAPNTNHAVSAFSDACIILNIILRASTFDQAFFGTMGENDILSDFFTRTLYHSPNRTYLLFRTGNDPEIISQLGRIYEESSGSHQYKNRMMNALINTFFILLLRNHGTSVITSSPDARTENNQNLIYILKYMQNHYTHITLKELAAFFNYSDRQLQRIIKASTGLSFSENILKLKMRQAARLLKNPDLTINTVAEQLGYSDAGNFRYVFKKYYNISPSEYRKKL